MTITVFPISDVPLVQAGDDLGEVLLRALVRSSLFLQDGDVLVLAQKIVSKSEGRLVQLQTVTPSARACELANRSGKDPRFVELVLTEAADVVRCAGNVLIVEHRLGFVMANAGIDMSNVEQTEDGTVLLLPLDPDRCCAELRERIAHSLQVDVAVIINDSHGRPWRNGTVGVAIGSAGLPALLDLRGRPDLYGRALQSTEVGLADELASAASLLMGQAAEGVPIVLIRGAVFPRCEGSARELIRPRSMDLFR